jgi:hypothetical protein
MKRRFAFAMTSLMLLAPGLGLVSGDAVGQQASVARGAPLRYTPLPSNADDFAEQAVKR